MPTRSGCHSVAAVSCSTYAFACAGPSSAEAALRHTSKNADGCASNCRAVLADPGEHALVVLAHVDRRADHERVVRIEVLGASSTRTAVGWWPHRARPAVSAATTSAGALRPCRTRSGYAPSQASSGSLPSPSNARPTRMGQTSPPPCARRVSVGAPGCIATTRPHRRPSRDRPPGGAAGTPAQARGPPPAWPRAGRDPWGHRRPRSWTGGGAGRPQGKRLGVQRGLVDAAAHGLNGLARAHDPPGAAQHRGVTGDGGQTRADRRLREVGGRDPGGLQPGDGRRHHLGQLGDQLVEGARRRVLGRRRQTSTSEDDRLSRPA